jgi:hypothetical protein
LERAFAAGWLTHVLADKEVHPIVGRGVGEFLFGDRTRFADGADHAATHVKVETGLDALYSILFPTVRTRRMAQVFDEGSIQFLLKAYRSTYGVDLSPGLFLSSHRAATKRSVQGLVLVGMLGSALLARTESHTFSGVRWFYQRAMTLVQARLGQSSLSLAFLSPLPPRAWLVKEVNQVVTSFADLFFSHFDTGCENLPDFNLDTGQVESGQPTHGGAARAARALAGLRARRAEPAPWGPGVGGTTPQSGDSGLSGRGSAHSPKDRTTLVSVR